jgi:branched-chain amino acid transport system permease protein
MLHLLAAFDPKNFVDTFWSNTITGLSLGAIYALVALGYTLVYGVLKLINFANSEVFMLGTFGSVVALNVVLQYTSSSPRYGVIGMIGAFALMLLLSLLFSGGSAVALEFIAYRPLRRRNAPRLVFLISAIGASLVMASAVERFGPRKNENYPIERVWSASTTSVLGIGRTANIQVRNIIVVVGALLMMAALTLFVNKTRFGRGMRAVAQDQETARILGVNTDQIIVVTFLLGGLMAGAAAFLYMVQYQVTEYGVGFLLGVKSFTAAVLGGIGNLKGALIGGLLLGLLENLGAGLFGGKWAAVVAFVVLVVVLMFRPTGLLGESLGRARA